MSRALVSLLMVIIIAVAVFNIVSTLILVVIEKKQAIAILRVQGATRGHIIRIFMIQGSIIGLLGSCLGAVIGIVISLVLPDLVLFLEHSFHIQILKADVYPISYIPSDLRMGQVISVVLFATLFSFLTSLYPAWRATKVDAAEVLRYE
jgi:lipoprotein-releasing system permease protein